MNQPVAVIVLCGEERQGWIHPQLMMRIVEGVYHGLQTRRPVFVGLKCGVSPVENARNQIVQEFLASSGSWLVMIDNDVIPQSHFLKVLDAAEAEGKKVFGIPTPVFNPSGAAWNIGQRQDELLFRIAATLPNSGWHQCDYIGAAFLGIHRSVLEKIGSGWFDSSPTLTEDFSFCERATKAGFPIWFPGDVRCDHAHSIGLLKMFKNV
jgi:GT2 family glycosyltransferase